MKNSGGGSKGSKSSGSPRSSVQELRKDRKSHSGLVGSPKKGGHGGKFTWAGDGYSEAELNGYALDAKDPNYQEASEKVGQAKAQA